MFISKIFKGLSAFALMIGLAACAEPNRISESHYADAEMMSAQNVARCRVLSVRDVALGAQSPVSAARYGMGRQTQVTAAQTGGALGAAMGAALAQNLTHDDNIGMVVGALAGAALGSRAGSAIDARSPANHGLEYSVLDAKGQEQLIVQPYRQGDRIARAGSTCRIASGPMGQRVLPATGLPDRVHRPRTTGFY